MMEVFIGLIAPIVVLIALMLITQGFIWIYIKLATFARGAVEDG